MDELTRLLVSGRDGDRAALAAAVRRAQPDVWRLAVHLVGRDDADDVTQDAFLRAYRSLPGFRAESSGRTWLLAITRCACADFVRHSRRRRRLQDRLVSHHGDGIVADTDGVLGLDHLVAGLDDDRRTAFVLTQMLGCSYSEAAEICDTAVGTIRSRVARARADLLEQMRAADTA
ncbi:MAG: sigma-70 family RNA polymerase sigma factor [Acidimicrobiia bacterium]